MLWTIKYMTDHQPSFLEAFALTEAMVSSASTWSLLPLPPRLFSIIFIDPCVGNFPCSLSTTSLSCGYHKAFGRWKLAISLLKNRQDYKSIKGEVKDTPSIFQIIKHISSFIYYYYAEMNFANIESNQPEGRTDMCYNKQGFVTIMSDIPPYKDLLVKTGNYV